MPAIPWPAAPAVAGLAVSRPESNPARLVQFSCQRLLVVEQDFAAAFHHALCELSSSLTLAGRSDAPDLSAAVAHCVLWAALAEESPDAVEATVRDFAAAHHRHGFPDEAYAALGHALLRSVRATLVSGWSSELSSGWVSYAMWLRPHLESGARAAGSGAVPAGQASVVSLDLIHEALATRYFPGQERALTSVCTRVMLRTGADLRAPRAAQNTDPALVAQVLESLLLMGYAPVPALVPPPLLPPPSLSSDGVAAVDWTASAGQRSAGQGSAGQPSAGRAVAEHAAGHHRPWWRLRRRHGG